MERNRSFFNPTWQKGAVQNALFIGLGYVQLDFLLIFTKKNLLL